MATPTGTVSSYLSYLPPVLWSPPRPAAVFDLGAMLCVFEKVLTGIDDGVPVTHGDNSLLTSVIENVAGSPLPQTVRVTAGTGLALRAGSSYTYDGAVPEVITITAANANAITAVIRQNHVANQTIVNSSGVHPAVQSVIADLVTLYGAWTTPPDYFDWLAQWVALQSDPAWDDYARRSVLSKIVGIYTGRGTSAGFDEFFGIYAVSAEKPRVAVDNASKILFCRPLSRQTVPAPTLVSQQPLVAPQCLAIDPAGNLLVGDLGPGNATINPAVWRISPSGEYDYSAGPPAAPQPFQPASTPVAIACDAVNGGAYLIDLVSTVYELYRLTAPQVGTVTLSGTPDPTQTGTITVDGVPYTLPQSAANVTALAAEWENALNLTAPFPSRYAAQSAGATIYITAKVGDPADDLLLTATSSGSLQLTATGPSFGSSVLFATDDPPPSPSLGLYAPRGMVVNGAGHPLILDRGAAVSQPSATVLVDVEANGSPPTYAGIDAHPLPSVAEPLCLALRADGSLLVGDAAVQVSQAPADIVAVNPTTWTGTSLLAGMAPGTNPLVAPVGIVEQDADHLWVLDAGLRPYVPSTISPFTGVLVQPAAIYSVDLSVTPPAIRLVSEPGVCVYPRGMVGDGNGTLYLCDSGLPDITGYSARAWRGGAQQMAVVVHFQGDPTRALYSMTLSGTPTNGQQCTLTIGGVTFPLSETGGDSVSQQAAAWAAALNALPGFAAAYTALAGQNVVSIYAADASNPRGASIATTSSPGLTITGGRLAAAVTLSGVPTTGESARIEVDGTTYTLPETSGDTLAQQAAAWVTTLNGTTPFNERYVATASGAVLSVSYQAADVFDDVPLYAYSSAHLTLTAYAPPLAVGTVSLSGAPTAGESCTLTVTTTSATTVTLAEGGGLTVAQQASAWCATLDASLPGYTAIAAGDAVVLFAAASLVGSTGVGLSATSSPHLYLHASSAIQGRRQFLQSISDVIADEVPAHARWTLQSQLSEP